MTLRARFTLLVTTLLAVVLGVAGVVLEHLEARQVEASLDRRAIDAARTPILGPNAGPMKPKDDAGRPPQPDAREGEPPPPPPDEPEGDGPAGMAGPSFGPAPTRPSPDSKPAPVVRSFPAPPDGAHVEVFLFEAPRPSAERGEPTLRARAATGTPMLDIGRARAAFSLAKSGAVEHRTVDGRTFAVASEVVGGGREPPPPPRPGRPDGGRPPRGMPALVAVAFVETGPAHAEHAAVVRRTTLIGLGALVCGALLAFALAGRMLRPIRAAATAAESIEKTSQRLPTRGSKDELERLVVVLNGMLARLDDATERERRFLATASHELRRPLTALLGELELASAPGRDPPSLRTSIGLALDDGRAMRRLVDDLLHHARAQAGALRLAESDVDLQDVVSDAVDRSRRAIGNGAASRIAAAAIPAVTLRADADALRQVLENLLVNGATHGGPDARVTISATVPAAVAASDEKPADSAGLRIHVDDDGPGISSEDRARIFEPFGRGDRARTVPGFGLGLAIARDLVLAHGGVIEVVSPLRPGDAAHPGTRFTVRWPAARVGPSDR